ncbi:retrovirus-related pol polyprotein from transposon TNT 1-94 [Tanacetum coccineum]
MTTLAEFMIVSGAENRPPMLDKAMYNSWESSMLLYIKGKKNGRTMLESIENGPLVYLTVKVDVPIRKKKYTELTKREQLQDDCDVQATKIVLQGLPPDVYAIVNHCQSAKDILERVKLLIKGTELSYQECECKLYNEFDKFTSLKGETLHEYYLRFDQLINDMHIIGMTMQQVQLNIKFLNAFLTEWSKFVTEVKTCCSSIYPGDDSIAYLHKAMAFMIAVFASPFSFNQQQLRTSSNPRNQATIQGETAGQARVVKCYNYQGEGHMARQCTQPKRPRNAAWFKEKLMLAEAQEFGQVLDEEQLAFLADLRITNCHDVQPIIIHNATFQTDALDTYDTDCDDLSSAKVVLMTNLSSYGSDFLSEVPQPNTYQNNNMLNQSVQDTHYFGESLIDYVPDNE